MPWTLLLSLVLPPPQGAAAPGEPELGAASFEDATLAAGLDFTQDYGATGRFLYPETMAGGGGFFDADGDGDLDVLLVNGCSFPPTAKDGTHKLYRNEGNGTFVDVTAKAGLAVVHPGMGCAAADVDNDGDQDLLVTGVHRNLFFLNQGEGVFQETAKAAGLETGGWSTAAAFFDYDRDGNLDLVLGHYVVWSPEIEERLTAQRVCEYEIGQRDYCPVWSYERERVFLFRGRGDGTFEDVSEAAGFGGQSSKALGLAILDFDWDGWLDVYVANDKEPAQLFHNRGDGTFVEVGYESGLALDRFGNSYAGMGVDVCYGKEGESLALSVGNFSGEPLTFHERGKPDPEGGVAEFRENSRRVGIAGPTLKMVTFAVLFLDYDLDGGQDLFAVNGHVGRFQEKEGIPYRQPCQLFHHQEGVLVPAPSAGASPLEVPILGRGGAAGDVDGDGDLDLLVLENQGPARLLVNRTSGTGAALRVKLRGTKSNRDGIGALVTVESGGKVQRQRLVTGRGYLSMSELPLTFGLGAAQAATKVEIDWPSGLRDVFQGVPAGTLEAVEGQTKSGSTEVAGAETIVPYANRSLEELAALAKDRPEDAQLAKLLGTKALEEGELELAVEHLGRAQSLAPQDHVAAVQYARALRHSGAEEEAAAAVRSWFERFEEDVISMNALMYLGHLGESELGLLLLNECIRRHPDTANFYLLRGNILQKTGRLPEAVENYRLANEKDPEFWSANVSLAQCYLRMKDVEAAEDHARMALAVEPASMTALRLLALALLEQDRAEEALRCFTERLAERPDDFELRLEFANLLDRLGRTADAEFNLKRLVDRNPDSERAWVVYLSHFVSNEEGTRALQVSRTALEKHPRSQHVLYLSAFAQHRFAGNSREARRLLDRALEADPDHVPSWRLEARIATAARQPEEAIAAWSEVLRREPEDAEARRMIEGIRKAQEAREDGNQEEQR